MAARAAGAHPHAYLEHTERKDARAAAPGSRHQSDRGPRPVPVAVVVLMVAGCFKMHGQIRSGLLNELGGTGNEMPTTSH